MNAYEFIYISDDHNGITAFNRAQIISASYGSDELIIELAGKGIVTYTGDKARLLLDQLLPGVLAAGANRDTAPVTDSGSAHLFGTDDERAALVALLDDIERVEGCCQHLLRTNDGDLIHNVEVMNRVIESHAQIVERVQRACDVLAAFEDRIAANEQDETDIDGDELDEMRDLHMQTYEYAALIFNEMRFIKGGNRALAHLLIAQADTLINDYESALSSFRGGSAAVGALKPLDRQAANAIAGEAALQVGNAVRAYFASDWQKAQDAAAKALAVLADAYEAYSAPHMEAIRVMKQIDDEQSRRANETAATPSLEAGAAASDRDSDAQTRLGSDRDNRGAPTVTDSGSTLRAAAAAVAAAAINGHHQQQQEGDDDENRG